MSQIIRIVAAVVDTRQLTLYKEDGETLVIPQGDARIQRIIDEATPGLTSVGWADIDLDGTNHYKEFEEKTGGLVKLFRVTKAALGKFFTRAERIAKSTQLGKVPVLKQMQEAREEAAKITLVTEVPQGKPADEPTTQVGVQEPAAAPAKTPAETKLSAAVADIMANAVPVSDGRFSTDSVGEEKDHTLVAVVDGKVIPHVEKLSGQMERANSTESIGMVNFMKRIAAVAAKRQHSVQDLMKFMERGDLPVADDGCIVIYKVLKDYIGDKPELKGKIVDCHSSSVPQRIGSYVCMAESMVDHNRRNECSNGLHVARRQYLGNFSGNRMVLAKVAPEDVIAVPQYDANKMRVCGYHILFELTADDAKKLRAGHAMTSNTDAAQKLHKALRGDHVAKLEEVRITQSMGGGVIITPLVQQPEAPEHLAPTEIAPDTPVAHAIEEAGAAQPVDPKDVRNATVEARKADTPAPTPTFVPTSRVEVAKSLLDLIKAEDTLDIEKRDTANRLVAFKKAAKVSWTALGLAVTDVDLVMTTAGIEMPPAKLKPAKPVKARKFVAKKVKPKAEAKPVDKRKPLKLAEVDVSTDKAVQKLAKASKPVDNSVKSGPANGPSSKIAALLGQFRQPGADKAGLAKQMLTIKKAAKKNWNKLGVDDTEAKLIEGLAS